VKILLFVKTCSFQTTAICT